MVPLQMELGGKDACLVFPDADVDLAAKSIVKGGFSYAGQRCTPSKSSWRLRTCRRAGGEGVREGIAKLKVGQPEENADITAVVSAKSADYIQGLRGGRGGEGGEDAAAVASREDNLVWPALVDGVTPEMRLCWEEPFGPIVPVVRVKTEEEALRFVNESKYGLQGCVFTRDVERAMRVADAMETGTVQINGPPARGPGSFPVPGRQGQRHREPGDHQLDRDDDQGEVHRDQPHQALVLPRVTTRRAKPRRRRADEEGSSRRGEGSGAVGSVDVAVRDRSSSTHETLLIPKPSPYTHTPAIPVRRSGACRAPTRGTRPS